MSLTLSFEFLNEIYLMSEMVKHAKLKANGAYKKACTLHCTLH